MKSFDAVVVGAGPNGLASAITLAERGLSVLLLEANDTIGGGARTAELTLPGFLHDYCSAIHPMALLSPFFRQLPLSELGVEWRYSPVAVAHPFDDGTAALLERSMDATADGLGEDAKAYHDLFAPFVARGGELLDELLRPISLLPEHPFLMGRFGLVALRSARSVARRFRSEPAQALFGGCAAHSFVPLDAAGSASFGMVLALSGHLAGWPCAKGGSGMISEALATHFRTLGGEIRTGTPVRSVRELPPSRAVIFDVTPRQLAAICRDDLPQRYLRSLQRYRYGPGVFKMDFALSGPIPWKAESCRRAATVHIGGSFEEIAEHERGIWQGRISARPFVLLAQQSLFDETRAPEGKHTAWAYCHVPHASTDDVSNAVEAQIERFAPGFRDLILARRTMNTAQYEVHDLNFVGGDVVGGANVLRQVLMRPTARLDPYSTPNRRIYIGSSSTPPGGGVHGMCGYWAAKSALRRVFGVK